MSDEKMVITSKQYFTDIGNAIRNKLGDYTKKYTPEEMPDAIRSIQTNTFVTSFLHDKTALYSGTIGSCSWEISTKGVLFIYAGMLPDISRGTCEDGKDFVYSSSKTTSPWYNYRSFIKLVSFEGPVIAGPDMSYFFQGLDKLWLVNSLSYLSLTKTTNISCMFQNCKGIAGVDFSVNDFTNILNMSYIFDGCAQIMEIKFPDIYYVDYHCGYDVQYLQYAFRGCVLLDRIDLSFLDEGMNIVNMEYIFYNCTALESITTRFKRLNKLTSLKMSFYNCYNLTDLDCSNWTTTNALTTFQEAFENCVLLTVLDLTNIDISGVNAGDGLYRIFYNCSALGEIKTDNGWVFHANADVGEMFANCSAYLNTREWDVSALQSFEAFFQDWQSNQELDFTLWDTSNASNMKSLFRNCTNLTKVNLFSFEPTNCTSFAYMFYNCQNLKLSDITFFYNFDSTKKVTDISYMFYNCISFDEFHFPFNTYRVTNYSYLLYGCYKIKEIDLTTWVLFGADGPDGSPKDHTINGIYMFHNCAGVREIRVGNSYNYNLFLTPDVKTDSYGAITSVTYKSPVFPIYMYEAQASIEIDPESIKDQYDGIPTGIKTYYGCGALSTGREVNGLIKALVSGTSYASTLYTENNSSVKVINFRLATGTESEEFFDNDTSWHGIGYYYNRAGAYASWDEETATVTIVTAERFILFNKNCESLFRGFRALETINFNYINTRSVTTFESAFQECRAIEHIDFSQFYTAKNTTLKNCFNNCVSLIELDLSQFETASLVNIETMLLNAYSLQTLTFFNNAVGKTLNAKEVFNGCTSLTTFNQPLTTNLFLFSNLDGAFFQCSALTSLNLNNWSISGLTSLSYVFANCTSLEVVDIQNWVFDQNNLKILSRLFQNCTNLYSIKFPTEMQDLVPTDISYMFQNCEKLGTTKTLVNDEYSYIPSVFTLPGMLLQNFTSGNTTTRINATGVLAGCKGIKELDLTELKIVSTETLDNSNLLSDTQKNLDNWTKFVIDANNWNFSYDEENDVNEFSYRAVGGWERLYLPISVIANKNYIFSLVVNSSTGFPGSSRAYVSGSVPNNNNAWTNTGNRLGNTVDFTSAASDTGLEYTCSFNSGNRTTIYLAFDMGNISDGVDFSFTIKNIGLYKNNANALPVTTDFVTAQTGPQGGYALDTVITGPLVGGYFYNNNTFVAREPLTASVTYTNSDEETFNAIPANVEGIYTINYLNIEQEG